MNRELIAPFVAWCKETAAQLDLDLLAGPANGIVRVGWDPPRLDIRAEFQRRLKEIDPGLLYSPKLFWGLDPLYAPLPRAHLRKAAALVSGLASNLSAGESTPKADSKADNENKSLPDSADVRDLCRLLQKGLFAGKTQMNIAREFTGNDAKKAKSLLRQARRYRHLWR